MDAGPPHDVRCSSRVRARLQRTEWGVVARVGERTADAVVFRARVPIDPERARASEQLLVVTGTVYGECRDGRHDGSIADNLDVRRVLRRAKRAVAWVPRRVCSSIRPSHGLDCTVGVRRHTHPTVSAVLGRWAGRGVAGERR